MFFDDPFVEEQANDNPNLFMMLNSPPVIYDEVQRTPGLFRFIKINCDATNEKGLFCLSGSQPLELMEKASESLSGRVSILELSGLSLREIQASEFTLPFCQRLITFRKGIKPLKCRKIYGKLFIAAAIPNYRIKIFNGLRFIPVM